MHGYTLFFLISAQKYEAVLTSTHNLCFVQKYDKYLIFFCYLKLFLFWCYKFQNFLIGLFSSFYHCDYLIWGRESWSECFSCIGLRVLVCVSFLFLLVSGIGCNFWFRHFITTTRLFKYIENFTTKYWKFSDKNSNIIHISTQNINCRYSLEPPRWCVSNEYPQSMFWSRNKKNNIYPCKPQF